MSWALILGASSGFGAACAKALAAAGYDICGVHLDRRSTLPQAEAVQEAVRAKGREAEFHNVNAADPERIDAVCDALGARAGEGEGVGVLLHSLAFGTLKPFTGEGAVTRKQLEMTLDVMANSLLYWAQALQRRELLRRGSRIFAMTSEGGEKVWPGYGPVSAAKSALESHCRQLAYELAPGGVTVNALLAGVTDTPALRKIPGHERMIESAVARHPQQRLTTPEDLAAALVALAAPGTAWMTGNVIRVDGGETLAG